MLFSKVYDVEYDTPHDEKKVIISKSKKRQTCLEKSFYLLIGQPLSFALRIESMQEGRNK